MADWLKFFGGIVITVAALLLLGVHYESAKFKVTFILASTGLMFYFLHEYLEFIAFLDAPILGFQNNDTPVPVWKFVGITFGLIAIGCLVFW